MKSVKQIENACIYLFEKAAFKCLADYTFQVHYFLIVIIGLSLSIHDVTKVT